MMPRIGYCLLLGCLPLGCLLLSSCRSEGPKTLAIAGHTWQVELALDNATREKGMAGRTSVPPGTGMLFVFPREEETQFHMLNCYAALDVAFIAGNGYIAEIRTMPVESNPAHPQALYGSRAPVLYALEVGAGELEKAGVKVGDKVEFSPSVTEAAKEAR